MSRSQINFRVPETLKEDIEQWADDQGLSVSEWLREAARKQRQREMNQ